MNYEHEEDEEIRNQNMRFLPHCILISIVEFALSFLVGALLFRILGLEFTLITGTVLSTIITVVMFFGTGTYKNFDQDYIYSGKSWFPQLDDHEHRLPEIFHTGPALIPSFITMTERASIRSFPISGNVRVMCKDDRVVEIPFSGQASPDPKNPYAWFLIKGPNSKRIETVSKNIETSIQGFIDSNVNDTSRNIMNDNNNVRRNLVTDIYLSYDDEAYRLHMEANPDCDLYPEGRAVEIEYGIQLGRIILGDMSLDSDVEKLLAAAANNKDIDKAAAESVALSGGTMTFLEAKKLQILLGGSVPGSLNIEDFNINAPQGGGDIMSLLGMLQRVTGGAKNSTNNKKGNKKP